MKTDTTSAPAPRARTPDVRATGGAPLMARLVLARLARIRSGRLAVVEGGRRHAFGESVEGVPDAAIEVRDARFWSAVAQRGSVGAGEAWAHGWWTSDDPTALVRLFVRNEDALSGVDSGLARLSQPAFKLWHALRPNTERGSRANIAAHYDLSNEFFALFLDDTLTYSCGVFERPEATLREASLAKIDRLCAKLGLAPGMHLVEIGTGWGAFALHAAREYGCRVTTTTISAEQHRLEQQRIRAAGLEERITLLAEDYRRLPELCGPDGRPLAGSFDRLVSVEMVEAIGHAQYPTFFETCAALLKPDGRMALQAITIADQHYERARRSVDFIQRHIFPGCCIPSVTALSSAMTRASDLKLVQLEDIGPHYARTLASWRDNLRAHRDEAHALGFDDTFLRLWDFYLCNCEGGFAERRLGDVQMVLERPGARAALPGLAGMPVPR
jgi:cyclopropane-fatty-acyl-phospholipid synthase